MKDISWKYVDTLKTELIQDCHNLATQEQVDSFYMKKEYSDMMRAHEKARLSQIEPEKPLHPARPSG